LSAKINVLQTARSERELLLQYPLTLHRAGAFAAGFISSFLHLGWYAGTWVFVVVGIGYALRHRGRVLLPALLLIAFVMLYALHVRSYYEMRSGYVEPQAALRFSMNFMGLWSVMAGIGLNLVWRSAKFQMSKLVQPALISRLGWIISGALLVGCFIATKTLLRDEVEDEEAVRLAPAREAIAVIERNHANTSYIISIDPLVLQMYADSQTNIVDLEAVDIETLKSIVSSDHHSNVVLLKELNRFTDVDVERYGEPMEYITSLPSSVIASGRTFQILQVSPDR